MNRSPTSTTFFQGPTRAPIPTIATFVPFVTLGCPTRGSSPRGFDCSGLVLYSYRAAGISGLPHSAQRLRAVVTPLGVSQVEPGDLLHDGELKFQTWIPVNPLNITEARDYAKLGLVNYNERLSDQSNTRQHQQ
ncbi:MAG: C40 family peptidase, partial [Gemmatimonadetes bacterium]|nr:C40 family peptidase [Gemmatimonadota bacterium]